MPACRKSWVRTANFWNRPRIGSFIQKLFWLVNWTTAAIRSETIFVCSNGRSMDEVIPSNSWGYPFEKTHHSGYPSKKSHSFEWLRLSIWKKSWSTARSPYLAAEPFISTCSQRTLSFGWLECLESCSKCFFTSWDNWRHPFEIVC